MTFTKKEFKEKHKRKKGDKKQDPFWKESVK